MTQPRAHRAAALAVIGLLLCFGLPELGIGNLVAPGDGLGARLVHEGIWWAFGAAILLWVARIERQPLGSIGLRPPR